MGVLAVLKCAEHGTGTISTVQSRCTREQHPGHSKYWRLLPVLCASTSRVFAQLLYTEHCSTGPMDFCLCLVIFLVFFTTIASAGPAAYAACQAACAAGTVAAAHVAGPGAVAAYSSCQAACATSFLIPEPSCTIM